MTVVRTEERLNTALFILGVSRLVFSSLLPLCCDIMRRRVGVDVNYSLSSLSSPT